MVVIVWDIYFLSRLYPNSPFLYRAQIGVHLCDKWCCDFSDLDTEAVGLDEGLHDARNQITKLEKCNSFQVY